MARDLTEAVAIIKSFEGIPDGNPNTINLDPYLCPAGYWTIGWGHVVIDQHGHSVRGTSNRVLAQAIYPNGITMEEAESLIKDDVRKFAIGVDDLVRVEISDTRFCSLVSFAFNVGLDALKNSTLLKLLNTNKFDEVPAQFLRWTKSNGVELAGLKRRRDEEAKLWKSVTT